MTSQPRTAVHPLRKILMALAAATCAAVLAGCASSPAQESAGEYIDSSVITAKVKVALLNAENLTSSQISVASFKGGVQLSGFVPTETDKSRRGHRTRHRRRQVRHQRHPGQGAITHRPAPRGREPDPSAETARIGRVSPIGKQDSAAHSSDCPAPRHSRSPAATDPVIARAARAG